MPPEVSQPTHLPRVWMDFNGYSLSSRGTQEDLARQKIELRDGMRFVFYDFDAQDDVSGLLHTEGVIWWDAKDRVFRIDQRTVNYRFTPGNDISVLDSEYP